MTYRIALNFEDGVTRFIDCKPTETVADAAYRQHISVPIDCRDGACGACKCTCESGTFRLGTHIEEALSQEEAAQRKVLTCQMFVQSDCVIQVPAASSLCKIRPSTLATTIRQVKPLSASTISLTLAGDDLRKLAFLPGQYANLTVPGSPQQRAYSFSSIVHHDEVSFLIRNVPGGLMSQYLLDHARPGDSIALSGPLGSFYLRPLQRPVLMLAGGTGLAPFLAMLETLQQQAGHAWPVHLIYGVNTDTDLVAIDQLQTFATALPGFSYSLVVVAADSSQAKKGFVTEHIEPRHLHDGKVDLYLCGPPPMVEAVSHHLQQQGIQPAHFHYEKFAPSR